MTAEISTISPSVVRDGGQRLYFFDNGYGASVVCHAFSYGGDKGLAELAVLKYDGEGDRADYANWGLCYSTPITNDVIGYLSEYEVQSLLHQIKELPCSVSDTST